MSVTDAMDRQAADALLERLRTFTTPELCDGAGLYHSMRHSIRSRVGRAAICGRALTVDVPSGEGGIVPDAILAAKPGDVIVIAGRGNCDCSYWGDHRSLCAQMTGAEAVVIDGAYRDHAGCEAVGFPIFALGLTCGTAGKSGAGALNVPVSCGGATVRPGDFIIGDVNGVCVLRPEEAEAAMERALAKRRLQDAVMRHMRRTGEVIPRLQGFTPDPEDLED